MTLKRTLRLIIALAFSIVTIVLVYQFAPPAASPALPANYTGRLAAWLGITWAMDTHLSPDIQQLATELEAHAVSDAYFYVSYLKADDTFNPTYQHAARFNHIWNETAPDVRSLAWIGIPITVPKTDGSVIANRLNDPQIRQQIADFSAFAITELGYAGVHLNVEPVPEGDPAFLETLALVRATLPDDAFFSITAHPLRLTRSVTMMPYPEQAQHWTAGYLAQVAQHVDQIALMAYDSGLPFPADYRAWVAYQTEEASRTLNAAPVELLIGVPVSEEHTPSHQTQAETLAAALHGFSIGQAAFPAPHVGLAIYPAWETDTAEWALLDAIFAAP